MASPALRWVKANTGLPFRPDANTVLWLPGQDDAYSSTIRDRSGNGNDGTIVGATWARNGKGLWYHDFDGADDYVTIGDVASLDITGDITIEMWFRATKLPSIAVRHFDIISKSVSAARDGYTIQLQSNDRIYFYTGQAAAGQATFTAAGVYVINTWYHLLVTRSGNDGLIYLNDVDITDSSAAHLDPIPAGQTAYLGGRATTNEFEGGIALTRVYDAVVEGHYNEERHLFGV